MGLTVVSVDGGAGRLQDEATVLFGFALVDSSGVELHRFEARYSQLKALHDSLHDRGVFELYGVQHSGGVLLLPLTKFGVRMGSAESVTFDDGVLPLRQARQGLFYASSDWFRALWRVACQDVGVYPHVYLPYFLRPVGLGHR